MDKLKKQGSRIAELIDKGREQGYLTYADVNDHLPEDISDPDQVDEIIGMMFVATVLPADPYWAVTAFLIFRFFYNIS